MNVLGKRVMLLCLTTTLVLLAGCERHQKSEQYFLIATNVDLPYWQSANDGLQSAAQQYGVTAEMDGPSTFDPQAEEQAFRAAVAKKPAGILVSVADANLMTPEIDSAVSAGIPVITVDSDAPDSKRLYFIGTNNLQAGRIGGERAARQLDGKGNVVFFSMPGQPNLDERLKGYEDAFSKFPGINITEIFDMKGNSGTAMDKAQEYLARTGKDKVTGFICLEASAGKDVAEAFRRGDAAGRVLVAMDVDPATLNLVKEGIIDSTLSQKPYTMALYGLKALDDVHHYPVQGMGANYNLDPFSPFPRFVDTGVTLVDKTNVESVLSHMSKK
ncbi:MAG: substrate-binding domain-containing protein [Acidobacteriaceae bacterium]